MTDVFETIKNRLNIKDVAEYYGIKISENNKALCVFHNDKHPSLSFKDNFFHCFACGAKGSVLDLTMKLFNLDVLQGAKKLNDDFNLGLFPKALSEKQKIESFKNEQKREMINLSIQTFNEWKSRTEKFFIDVYRNLWGVILNCGPQNFGEPHRAWVLAVKYIDPIGEILDDFLREPKGKILQNYKIYNSWKEKLIKEIEEL